MRNSVMLRNATVLDEGGGFTGPIDLLALDGSVAARGARLDAPPDGVPTVDFSGLWVMPGVFDCHTHITASATAEAELLRTPMSRQVLETAQNLRRTLEGGVTFIRDGAGADAGIRDSVEAGYVAGPRMCRSASTSSPRPGVTATGSSRAPASTGIWSCSGRAGRRTSSTASTRSARRAPADPGGRGLDQGLHVRRHRRDGA